MDVVVPFCFFSALFLRFFLIGSENTDIGGIEQNVVYSIQKLLYNGDLYSSPASAPFAITQYTPLYYLLCGLFAKIFHLDPSMDIHRIYVTGRSLNLLLNLGNAFLIYKIARRIFDLSSANSKFLFCISFVLSFSFNYAVRPDSLAEFAAIASIYFFLLYLKTTGTPPMQVWTLLFSVLLSAISAFSKQSGIQLIIIYAGFAVLMRNYRMLGYLIGFSVLIYGAFLAIALSFYPYLLENVIGGIANGISIKFFILIILEKNLFLLTVIPLIILASMLIWRTRGFFEGYPTDRFLAVSVIGTFIFAFVTALKMGSTIQYFVVFMNLSFLLIFNYLYNPLRMHPTREAKLFKSLPPLFLTYSMVITIIYLAYIGKQVYTFNIRQEPKTQRIVAGEVIRFLKNEIKGDSGNIVFANISPDYPTPARQGINNYLFKNCIFPQLDIIQNSTKPLRVIDYESFENDLQNGKIKYIIETQPPMEFIISKNYVKIRNDRFHLVKQMDEYLIYGYNQ